MGLPFTRTILDVSADNWPSSRVMILRGMELLPTAVMLASCIGALIVDIRKTICKEPVVCGKGNAGELQGYHHGALACISVPRHWLKLIKWFCFGSVPTGEYIYIYHVYPSKWGALLWPRIILDGKNALYQSDYEAHA